MNRDERLNVVMLKEKCSAIKHDLLHIADCIQIYSPKQAAALLRIISRLGSWQCK